MTIHTTGSTRLAEQARQAASGAGAGGSSSSLDKYCRSKQRASTVFFFFFLFLPLQFMRLIENLHNIEKCFSRADITHPSPEGGF